MKAVVIHNTGGIEVLSYEDIPIPKIQNPNEVKIRNVAIGVNNIDTYHRSGLYKVPLPFILGRDGSGIVEEVGTAVTEVKVGDRVAYIGSGSHAEFTIVPINAVVQLPDTISFEIGTAAMVQALTAYIFTSVNYPVKKGDTVLIHAAAGGLGLTLCQIAKHLGARVIGTTSTLEKATIAKSFGCDEVILYTQHDFVEETMKLTNGKGVNVIYDSVGKTTFAKGFECLARRGVMVSCGSASGKPDQLDIIGILSKGSLTVCRPLLSDYVQTREEFFQSSTQVFDWISNGVLKFKIGAVFPLKEIASAHNLLEGRQTTGKIILTL